MCATWCELDDDDDDDNDSIRVLQCCTLAHSPAKVWKQTTSECECQV